MARLSIFADLVRSGVANNLGSRGDDVSLGGLMNHPVGVLLYEQRASAVIIVYSTQLSVTLKAEMPSWAEHQ